MRYTKPRHKNAYIINESTDNKLVSNPLFYEQIRKRTYKPNSTYFYGSDR
ncbi:hypothetical protein MIDIC_70004 [Alphaproteobacteria bacterium]